MIKSKEDWSGTVVNGVTLGVPATDEDGNFVWDGGVPTGTIDSTGMFQPVGEDFKGAPLPKVDVGAAGNVAIKELEKDEAVTKGTVVKADEVIYTALTDTDTVPPGKSWKVLSSRTVTDAKQL